ncbi:MAG: methylated-DNA--[protein]-cysteine S-methyltransferase [Verrucomicrobia bacterium]|nr:methylated-DNA--[protein]-cysteine S-methyltransferase [Verrucomicrobiota bacterium]
MNLFFDTFRTPLGDFSVAVDEAGAVVATAFGARDALGGRAGVCHLMDDKSRVAAAREQVLAYFAGKRTDFDLVLAPQGTPFQQRVWAALRQIPFGETRSYGALAAQLGNPSASRAIGRANATNPICLIVPCHRVIGADGSLTGFAFGEAIKRRLLEHERVPAFCAA